MAKRKRKSARRNKKEKLDDVLHDFVGRFLEGTRQELEARWTVWPRVISKKLDTEVAMGLVRRQYCLCTHLAMSPHAWTIEFAPIVWRCMVEVHIWLAWILENPGERSPLFVNDGIGKEKLIIKHRSDELLKEGRDVDGDPVIQEASAWVESQKYSFLVDVNLNGSWSGIDTRKMADEAGCGDFYRYTYPKFSSAVHSTWNHISRFDLQRCTNPLHAAHYTMRADLSTSSPIALALAAKYLAKTFSLIDQKFNLRIVVPSTYRELFGEVSS